MATSRRYTAPFAAATLSTLVDALMRANALVSASIKLAPAVRSGTGAVPAHAASPKAPPTISRSTHVVLSTRSVAPAAITVLKTLSMPSGDAPLLLGAHAHAHDEAVAARTTDGV